MKNRTLAVGGLLAAIALIAVVALRTTPAPQTPAGAANAASAAAAPASNAPARRTDARKPAMPAAPTDKSVVSSPETLSYESAANLKPLVDTLEQRVASGDQEATRSLIKALDECLPLSRYPPWAQKFREQLPGLPPDQQAVAQHHIARFEQRCTDIARSGRIESGRLETLRNQATDLVALAERVGGDPAAVDAAERAQAVRRILASKNGEAIYALAAGMADVDADGNGLLGRYSGNDFYVYAWRFVGCDLGAPCGQDSALMRNLCTTQRQCLPGGYREHVQYYALSPHNFEITGGLYREILTLISNGRIDDVF